MRLPLYSCVFKLDPWVLQKGSAFPESDHKGRCCSTKPGRLIRYLKFIRGLHHTWKRRHPVPETQNKTHKFQNSTFCCVKDARSLNFARIPCRRGPLGRSGHIARLISHSGHAASACVRACVCGAKSKRNMSTCAEQNTNVTSL